MLLSLGEFSEKELSPDDRKGLLPKMQEMYRTATDPGLHAASEWLLRTWKQNKWLAQVNEAWAKDKEQREKREEGIRNTLAKEKEKALPQWYVNGQGQTMVVIPGPVTFMMGSPPTETGRRATEAGRRDDEKLHKRRIGRTFALAAQSVTWEQYLKFAPQDKDEREDKYSSTMDCPVNYISWEMAVRYCNWLSKEEGIDKDQWCYETDAKGKVTNLRENYLGLTGYRLPTEAEMEYATRAGAKTARYLGEADELLPKYAWYLKNSQERTWPVGSLKPNDLGLFDVQGNVYTWCQESFKIYPTVKDDDAAEDQEDRSVLNSTSGRVLRVVLQSCVERAFCPPSQQCADVPGWQFRFASGEDFCSLISLLHYSFPDGKPHGRPETNRRTDGHQKENVRRFRRWVRECGRTLRRDGLLMP